MLPNCFLFVGEEDITYMKKMMKRFAQCRRGTFKTGRMRVPEYRIREDRSNELYKQKRRSHCNRIPMTVRCARVCIALREQANENIHTMCIHASCRVGLDESITIVSRVNCMHNREADRVSICGPSNLEYLIVISHSQ